MCSTTTSLVVWLATGRANTHNPIPSLLTIVGHVLSLTIKQVRSCILVSSSQDYHVVSTRIYPRHVYSQVLIQNDTEDSNQESLDWETGAPRHSIQFSIPLARCWSLQSMRRLDSHCCMLTRHSHAGSPRDSRCTRYLQAQRHTAVLTLNKWNLFQQQ